MFLYSWCRLVSFQGKQILFAEIFQEYVCNQIYSLKSIFFCDVRLSGISQKTILFRVTAVNVKSNTNILVSFVDILIWIHFRLHKFPSNLVTTYASQLLPSTTYRNPILFSDLYVCYNTLT